MSGGIYLINTKPHGDSQSPGGMILTSLRGTLVGIGTAALLALILTAVSLFMRDPDKLLDIFAYASLVIGAFTCGIASASSGGENKLLSALVSGIVYSVLLWLISLFFRASTEEPLSAMWTLLGYIGCVLSALLGGFIVAPKKARIKDSGDVTAEIRHRLKKRM